MRRVYSFFNGCVLQCKVLIGITNNGKNFFLVIVSANCSKIFNDSILVNFCRYTNKIYTLYNDSSNNLGRLSYGRVCDPSNCSGSLDCPMYPVYYYLERRISGSYVVSIPNLNVWKMKVNSVTKSSLKTLLQACSVGYISTRMHKITREMRDEGVNFWLRALVEYTYWDKQPSLEAWKPCRKGHSQGIVSGGWISFHYCYIYVTILRSYFEPFSIFTHSIKEEERGKLYKLSKLQLSPTGVSAFSECPCCKSVISDENKNATLVLKKVPCLASYMTQGGDAMHQRVANQVEVNSKYDKRVMLHWQHLVALVIFCYKFCHQKIWQRVQYHRDIETVTMNIMLTHLFHFFSCSPHLVHILVPVCQFHLVDTVILAKLIYEVKSADEIYNGVTRMKSWTAMTTTVTMSNAANMRVLVNFNCHNGNNVSTQLLSRMVKLILATTLTKSSSYVYVYTKVKIKVKNSSCAWSTVVIVQKIKKIQYLNTLKVNNDDNFNREMCPYLREVRIKQHVAPNVANVVKSTRGRRYNGIRPMIITSTLGDVNIGAGPGINTGPMTYPCYKEIMIPFKQFKSWVDELYYSSLLIKINFTTVNNSNTVSISITCTMIVVYPLLLTYEVIHSDSASVNDNDNAGATDKTTEKTSHVKCPRRKIPKIENNYFLKKSIVIYFNFNSNKIDFNVTVSKYACDICDVHKGSVLYAPPELLDEHFVFLLKLSGKGETISITRPIYLTFKSEQKSNSIRYNKIFIFKSKKPLKNKIPMRKKILGNGIIANKGSIKLESIRHVTSICYQKLMNDVELNPGPDVQINAGSNIVTVVSLNCRGLGSIDKTRLLLNKFYNLPMQQPLVVMLQETMVVGGKYFELAWRGKFVQTAGTGNSQGCVTLVNFDSEISDVQHYGNRGHQFKLTCGNGEVLKIFNIYAPNGFDVHKNNFFNTIFEDTAAWDGPIIIGGDFNTTMGPAERHNRGVTAAELRTAEIVKNHVENQNLVDCWDSGTGFTWRKGKSMSRLDRIYTRVPSYEMKSLKVKWTLTTSDHAGLVLTLAHKQHTHQRNEHVKLDNTVVQNKELLAELTSYVTEQLQTATDLTPHVKLEFAKMSIRTKALEIMGRNRRKENERLRLINEGIKENMRLLTVYTDPRQQIILAGELEELNKEKDELLCKQGEALAMRAKTKWYNEGERSNKYFLNLLKRHNESSEMKALLINGQEVTDDVGIRNEVTQFYHELYNKDEAALTIDDHFLDEMFTVDEATNCGIGAPVTLNELWLTLKPTKATTPGPDGISNTYLKKLWGIIGPLILEAWNFSLRTGVLPPSHKTSLLRLIPKAGKDHKLLKNWRPITLSNCDHKLITRLYNNRLLNAIGHKIGEVQTAYIKGRSISDNLRLLNSATKLADCEENINATIIALDAQKAFDSVSHNYITKVLNKVGLTQLVPVFRLLYKELSNDIIINGRIGKGYKLGNGVKQGDALSCSLFILAIEPLIRNITKNNSIKPVSSRRLGFTWPKLVAYADDITILTHNERDSVNAIFEEYYRLTKASGLQLNADKTEKFDIYSRNINRPAGRHSVRYGNNDYNLTSLESIKLNGIIFNKDRALMQQGNFELMMGKMTRHFKEWGRRSLSLLGKIQIIKTFGISQYLYALAVLDLDSEQWRQIEKEIHRFLWNKSYDTASNQAPHRLKKEIVYTDTQHGGLGMVNLASIMHAARLKRYSYLLTMNNHPMASLQRALGADGHLQKRAKVDIDDVTSGTLKLLREHHLTVYDDMCAEDIETDLLMHRKILGCAIKDVMIDGRANSIESTMLRRRGVSTVLEAITDGPESVRLLCRIAMPQVHKQIKQMGRAYRGTVPPDIDTEIYIFNNRARQWHRTVTLSSRQIRLLIWEDKYVRPKLLELPLEGAAALFGKIAKLKNVQNKTKLLRLIHGDVYCGVRLYRFGLAESDRCIRCFGAETINHLLYECPYSAEVWGRLGLSPGRAEEIINGTIIGNELELRAEIISQLVYRRRTLPPEVLLSTVMKSFRMGLSKTKGLQAYAASLVERHELTGQWFT
jgi:hypothetical protein